MASAPMLRRSNRRSASSASLAIQQATSDAPHPSPARQRPPPSKRQKVKAEPEALADLTSGPAPLAVGRSSATRKVKAEPSSPRVKHEPDELDVKLTPASKKRRTKKEDEADEVFPSRPSPLASASTRTASRGLYIGAHISSAGGVENAPLNALRIGANAFSCFVRPKMQWASTPIASTSAEQFKQRVLDHAYMPRADTSHADDDPEHLRSRGGFVVPHGCYLVNLANPDEAKRDKSFEAFVDDLQRCEQLGIRLFNFHPGSMTVASVGSGEVEERVITGVRAAKADACALVASYINRAHALTADVIILVENMAGSKNDTLLGSSLADLACILASVHDKSRIGVCIDTCHAFAAGYDLTTPQSWADFAAQIHDTVGWPAVRAMHLNDSKFGLACRRDRHANIGRGCIGLGGFWNVVNDPRCCDIPLILETPALGSASAAYAAKEATAKCHQVWACQIQALHALRGTEWGKWKAAEAWLEQADEIIGQAEAAHALKKTTQAKTSKTSKPTKTIKKKAQEAGSDSELSSDEG